MHEYIECEAAYRFAQDQLKKETGAYTKGWNNAMNVMKSAFHNNDAIPAADVVARDCYDRLLVENDELRKERSVVRCGECKYSAVMIDELNYAVGEAINKLAAYEDAEEQGLSVRFPCKVGDTVHFIFRGKVYSGLILHVNLYKGFETQSITMDVKNSVRGHVLICAEEIGKTVFLTREEAEAALKGEREDV